jgi:hypothetical protein
MYYPTPAQPVPLISGTIVGQNATSASFGSCSDDTPVIQAWINANPAVGTLSLVNVVMKTKLNLLGLAGTGCRIKLYGVNRYAVNVAELELPTGITLDGDGGGGSAPFPGSFACLKDSMALWWGISSGGNGTQEPAQYSAGSYVDGSYHFMCSLDLNTVGAALLPPGSVGMPFMVTSNVVGSGTDPTYNTSFKLISQQYINPANPGSASVVFRLIWTGTGSPPTPGAQVTSVQWSCNGVTSPMPSNARFGSFGLNGSEQIPCILVLGANGVDLANCWKQWATLTDCHNAVFNEKIHRIMGADSTTGFYVNAQVPYRMGTTLPDYGAGTSPTTATIKTYQAAPAIRMTAFNTVRNIYIPFAVAPGYVVDSTLLVTINCYIENVGYNQTPTPNQYTAAVPVIMDGCFYFGIDSLYVGGANNANAAVILTNTTTWLGQYCGIGRISNVQLTYLPIVVYPETVGIPFGDFQFSNIVSEAPVAFPGEATAMFYFKSGTATGLVGMTFTDCTPADLGGYLLESIGPPGNLTISDIVVNNPGAAIMGPNMQAANVQVNGTGLAMTAQTRNYSTSVGGWVDNIEAGRHDSFAPIATLPAAWVLPMPPLLTVADWQALTQPAGTVSITQTSDIGPDFSVGKMIRVNSPTGAEYVQCSPGGLGWSIASPAAGDAILFYMRCRALNPAHAVGQAGAFEIEAFGTGFTFTVTGSNTLPLDNQISSYTSVAKVGEWVDMVSFAQVATPGTGGVGFLLFIGSQAGETLIVDPESVALAYIPAGQSSAPELLRIARKFNAQITNATAGDVAIPSRTGLSFGGAARLATQARKTTSITAQPIYSTTLASGQAVTYQGSWTAVTSVSAGTVSGGSFTVTAFNNAGTVTISTPVYTGNYNLGALGAAASPNPITVTTTPGSGDLTVNVVAQATTSTDWQLLMTQVGVS